MKFQPTGPFGLRRLWKAKQGKLFLAQMRRGPAKLVYGGHMRSTNAWFYEERHGLKHDGSWCEA